jgi:hypothetical protein
MLDTTLVMVLNHVTKSIEYHYFCHHIAMNFILFLFRAI